MAGSPHDIDRRSFLRDAGRGVGALAAGELLTRSSHASAATAAGGEVRLGLVGCGRRGFSLLNWGLKLGRGRPVRWTAVADIKPDQRTAAAAHVEKRTGHTVAVCGNAAELCLRDDVDAVLIATADFQHASHALIAALSGKHVYLEPPFGVDPQAMRECRDLIDYAGVVFQSGAAELPQQRSAAAAAFLRSGRLGQVQAVEVSDPIMEQRWRNTDRTPVPLDRIDVADFLGDVIPDQPLAARHIDEFRLFEPYSLGVFGQQLEARLEQIATVLDGPPLALQAMGGVTLWRDGRTTPDTAQVTCRHAGDVVASLHVRMGNAAHGRGVTVYGTAGTLEVDKGIAYGNGGKGLVVPPAAPDGPFAIDRSRLLPDRRAGVTPVPLADDGPTGLERFLDRIAAKDVGTEDLDRMVRRSMLGAAAHRACRSGETVSVAQWL